MRGNRAKYYRSLADIIQPANFITEECLLRILVSCLLPIMMYRPCCVFRDKEILKPLDVELNDGFGRIFYIPRAATHDGVYFRD